VLRTTRRPPIFVAFFALLLTLAGAARADDFACGADALRRLDGYYADAKLLAAAPRLRAWPAALATTDAQSAGITIRDGRVHLSLAWHESDGGGHCVSEDAQGLWLRRAWDGKTVLGPYRRVAGPHDNEALAYLALLMPGCFDSSDAHRWCFARDAITVDGRPFGGSFSLDLSELPEYGTVLQKGISPGQPEPALPLLVFVPTPAGWDVYADDWLTRPGHADVVPGRTRPLFTLARRP